MTTVVFSPIWELFLPESGHRDADLMVLGRAVRRMREQRRMSAEALAGAARVDRELIHALESGHLDPTYEVLLALADGLGVQVSAVVSLAEELKASRGPWGKGAKPSSAG